MVWAVLVIALLVCVYLPSLWVNRVMHRYREPGDRYQEQGSGAELARHLLDRFDLADIKVEETTAGDHYDSKARAVRLTSSNYAGHSLTRTGHRVSYLVFECAICGEEKNHSGADRIIFNCKVRYALQAYLFTPFSTCLISYHFRGLD